MTQMFESFTNPSNKEQIEERMARIKEDPSLKPILDEIESGGPAAMMKWVILIQIFFPIKNCVVGLAFLFSKKGLMLRCLFDTVFVILSC